MKISVSILDANFQTLQQEIDSLHTADSLHLDIMDGHYVPNLSFGTHILQSLTFPIPTQTHLMVQNPEDFFDGCRKINTESISFHIEATGHHKALLLLKYLKRHNQKAGLALDLYTNPEWITPQLFPFIDTLTLLSVKSGYGGQTFQNSVFEKIAFFRKKGFHGLIEVDGGVTQENISSIAHAGADQVVIGSALTKINPEERDPMIQFLRERSL